MNNDGILCSGMCQCLKSTQTCSRNNSAFNDSTFYDSHPKSTESVYLLKLTVLRQISKLNLTLNLHFEHVIIKSVMVVPRPNYACIRNIQTFLTLNTQTCVMVGRRPGFSIF